MSADRLIADLLNELGFVGANAQVAAIEVLVAAGVLNGKKHRVSVQKAGRVETVLAQRLCRSCRNLTCQRTLQATHPPRELVVVEAAECCECCAGAANRRAMESFAMACRGANISRVVFVGGSPSVRSELKKLCPSELHLRLVEDEINHDKRKGRDDVAWAQLILVSAPSELSHRTSKHYTDRSGADRKRVLRVVRRGIAAVLDEGTRWIEQSFMSSTV